jgi:hypothetical protein
MSNLQEDRAALDLEKEEIQQAGIFLQWVGQHPEFNFQSAHKLLKAYHNGEHWTLVSLSESAERLVERGVIRRLGSERIDADAQKAKRETEETLAAERADLVTFILENRVMSESAQQHERTRLSNPKATDIVTLRTIKENIVAKRALSQLPKEELKVIARGPQGQQWKPVPLIYRNRSMLLCLASENVSEFRRLTERCGHDQINAILAQPRVEFSDESV